MPSRRRFLHLATGTALGGSGLFGLGPLQPTAQAAQDNWLDLGEGLALVSGFGGSVVVSQGSDGVALVDSGSSEHGGAKQDQVDPNVITPLLPATNGTA